MQDSHLSESLLGNDYGSRGDRLVPASAAPIDTALAHSPYAELPIEELTSPTSRSASSAQSDSQDGRWLGMRKVATQDRRGSLDRVVSVLGVETNLDTSGGQATVEASTLLSQTREWVSANKDTQHLTPAARYELAGLWFLDALHFRTAHMMASEESRRAHRYLHQTSSRLLRKFALLVQLLLAFWEFPSGQELPKALTNTIDLLCCCTYVFELYCHYLIRGRSRFLRNKWKMAKCFLLLLTFLDCTLFSFVWNWRFHPLRALRVYYVVENSRDLRINFTYFMRLIVKVIPPLSLLAIVMGTYSVLGIILFGHWTDLQPAYDGYFNTLPNALLRLFALLTTVNFPDIMLPAYHRSPFYSAYFISYLVIGLYFLMNLILATVLFHYRRFLKDDYLHKINKQNRSLLAAFALVTNSEATDALTQDAFTRLLKAAYPEVGDREILAIFHSLDESRSHTLLATEFVEVCGTFRYHLSKQDEARKHRAEDKAMQRLPKWTRNARRWIKSIVLSKTFYHGITILIVANAIVVFVEALQVSEGRFAQRWQATDWTFTILFVSEIVLKFLADGPYKFWRGRWNRYDLFLISVAVVAEAATQDRPNGGAGALLYRSLMAFRLVGRVPAYEKLLEIVGRLIGPFSINFIALFVVFYVYAIIGIWSFYGRLSKDTTQGTMYNSSEYYFNVNFDTFYNTMIVLYAMMVVNNWHVIASGVIKVTSMWSALYFVSFYIVVVMIILNVVVAFFLEIFTSQLSADGSISSIVEWKIANKRKGAEMWNAQETRRRQLTAMQAKSSQLNTGTEESVTSDTEFYQSLSEDT